MPGILKKYAVVPRRRLSQSFLADDNIARKIVAAAALQERDRVLEIGAGHGVLTRLIVPRVRMLHAVEIDRELAAVLERELPLPRRIRIWNEDILKFDWTVLETDSPEDRCVVVGNIPYGIATEILFRLLEQRKLISRAILMVQKELAERLTGRPQTKAYGVPTVLLSMHARCERLFDVPPSCFYPVPRVVSTVIALNFRAVPVVALRDEKFFARFVKAAFAQRRKTLWNNLRNASWLELAPEEIKEAMDANGVGEMARAEDLEVATLGVLSNELWAAQRGGDMAPRQEGKDEGQQTEKGADEESRLK
ncbi:MAG: ribosomal RNA small subunit methyltransferase A [Syntrophobacterales bacterium]|nr:ribosomal RNA small subunit methyltransferase A [Syntrophobacterales bacterium]